MTFQKSHPSFKYLMLVERETPVIPVINYYNFPDTKLFVWTCTDDDDAIELLNENDPALDYMERYAKVAVVIFYLVFSLLDIQGTAWNILSYIRQFMSKDKLKEEHQIYLFNDKDYRNKLNSGCPDNPLKTTTKRSIYNVKQKKMMIIMMMMGLIRWMKTF